MVFAIDVVFMCEEAGEPTEPTSGEPKKVLCCFVEQVGLIWLTTWSIRMYVAADVTNGGDTREKRERYIARLAYK